MTLLAGSLVERFANQQFVPIIGIAAGWAGSGKSTLAKVFVEREGFVKLSFAEPLKLMCGSLLIDLGYDENNASRLVYQDKHLELPEIGVTSRYLQQTLGTEWGRQTIDPNIWLTAWAWRAWRAIKNGCRGIVVDDMRFRNELELVRRLGGVTVFVDRPAVVPGENDTWMGAFRRLLGIPPRTHPSEGAIKLEDVDVVLRNHWDLDTFNRLTLTLPAHVFDEINSESVARYLEFHKEMVIAERDRQERLASLSKQQSEA